MQTYTKAELYKVMQMECFDIPVAESDSNMFGWLAGLESIFIRRDL